MPSHTFFRQAVDQAPPSPHKPRTRLDGLVAVDVFERVIFLADGTVLVEQIARQLDDLRCLRILAIRRVLTGRCHLIPTSSTTPTSTGTLPFHRSTTGPPGHACTTPTSEPGQEPVTTPRNSRPRNPETAFSTDPAPDPPCADPVSNDPEDPVVEEPETPGPVNDDPLLAGPASAPSAFSASSIHCTPGTAG